MQTVRREFRWSRLAVLSASIRLGLASTPAAVVVVFAVVALRAMQHGTAKVNVVAWLGLTAGFTLGALLGFEAVAGRLRTLASLLDISMEFPYKPPSRLAVAITSPFNLELTQELDGVRHLLQRRRIGGDDASEVAVHLDRVESILTVAAITGTLEPGTRRHSDHVARLANRIGVEMGLDRDRRRWLRWAALLHDVGKLAVPEDVLHKPTFLNAAETRVVREHVANGARIVQPLIPLLGPWAKAVGEHHERWDGKGYPLGLRGEEISLAGRIVAVADTYATMTRGRTYRRRTSATAALIELRAQAGLQFDPRVVAAFEADWRRRRSAAVALHLPRAAIATLVAVASSMGAPAASAAAALGLVGAVAAVSVTAPAVARALPRGVRAPLLSVQQAIAEPSATPTAAAPSALPVTHPTAVPLAPFPVSAPTPVVLHLAPQPAARPTVPALDLPANATAVEGVAWELAGSVGAGPAPRLRVDFGDGSAQEALTLSDGQFRVAHVYLDEGNYALHVFAENEAGMSIGTTGVNVGEYQPAVYLPQSAPADKGRLSLAGQVVDPSSDAQTATVDYGDGQGPQALAVTGRTINLVHSYASAGTYPVTVTVRDDDGAAARATVSVTASQPGP